jgi:hypothetical protein
MFVNKDSTINELVDALFHNEEAQCNIKNVYIRAAEKDLAFMELKKEENNIRRYISIKIGI